MSSEAAVLRHNDRPGADAPGVGLDGPTSVRLNRNGILEIQLPPDRELNGDDARAAGAAALRLAGRRQLPVLLVISGTPGLSGDARQILTDALTAVASAFAIVGDSPVDRVIAHYLLRPKSGMVPARFFTAGSEAAEWLEQGADDN